MKLTRRKIQAASDYRTFDGYTMEELEECCPDIFYDFFYDIRNEARRAFVSKNPECSFIGAEDSNGDYFVFKAHDEFEGPGWFEVHFSELRDYLK